MRVFKTIILILLILTILIFGYLLFRQFRGQAPLPERKTEPLLSPTPEPSPTPAPPAVEPLPAPPQLSAEEEEGRLAQLYRQLWSYRLEGDCESDGENARQLLTLTVLDTDRLAGSGLREELIGLLSERVSQARRPEEIYDEDSRFEPALLRSCYESLLQERTERYRDFITEQPICLQYRRNGENWELLNGEELFPGLPDSEALYAAATAELPYLPLHFSLPEDAVRGSVPDENGYVVTDDPAVISALLERPEAKALIGDQTLVWNPDIFRIPDTKIYCYLDESILCIVWQEPEVQAVGTFAEVFVSDGSQLRRKISSDTPWSLWFEETTKFARQANAVLAVGGDFYYHGRKCGIAVYNREIIRFRPDNADTCFITADGDMLFIYKGSGLHQEEVEQYLRENDVVFSLVFGPVLIDDGVDVTPEYYSWGEINEYYARSALGMLGRHHYLTMNINCDPERPEYDHLPNLRNAADAMIKRGCWKAYTLDGGQTATTAFHYELINPVQFGWQKQISDIIYFASAIPEE